MVTQSEQTEFINLAENNWSSKQVFNLRLTNYRSNLVEMGNFLTILKIQLKTIIALLYIRMYVRA